MREKVWRTVVYSLVGLAALTVGYRTYQFAGCGDRTRWASYSPLGERSGNFNGSEITIDDRERLRRSHYDASPKKTRIPKHKTPSRVNEN